ncbi:hypothetical protein M404DRAFT_246366 [Pisolithus tinctorius Marx 270]|uniref:Fungal-type protein kinase domain-containing protein n=1 Tax=Pisolithus tinctorius Marx 270 TaxID=870435 RepID=A0A0C3JFM2_PISTI|nr:hypothetical protein M404DRAFT_246366 [Pisolithus tinctorius Marx 270]
MEKPLPIRHLTSPRRSQPRLAPTVPRPQLTCSVTSMEEYDSEDGGVCVAPLKHFKSAALPPLCEQVHIVNINVALRRHTRVWSRRLGRWSSFDINPKDLRNPAEEVLKVLSDIFGAVIQEAEKTAGKAKLRFGLRPKTIRGPERIETSFPDAYLLLADKRSLEEDAGVDSWHDIAVSFGLKQDAGVSDDCKDDEEKVISALHHIMHGDPCRRATFGVTIDNTQMRFWFTCRAVTFMSEPFNFMTEPEHLIYFFCSLAFARDHELGWDPTIKRVRDGCQIQYDISVQSEDGETSVYRTTRVISDFGAGDLTGQGTRIFEATLQGRNGISVNNNERIVLKDSWRESDQAREDKILEQIFADLGEKADEARKYFLTVRDAADVFVDGKIDDTVNLLCRLPVGEEPQLVLQTTGVGLPPGFIDSDDPSECLKVQHKTHFRLVFHEVFQPVRELQSFAAVYETLQNAREGLELLHSVRWVHCDINPENVLRTGQSGKITGLEFAKRLGSDATHDVHRFTACEIAYQRYLFEPSPRLGDSFQHPRNLPQSQRMPFSYNPLHDLESLWWIQAWMIYFHVDHQDGHRSPGQTRWFHELFPRSRAARFAALATRIEYDMLPASFRKAAHALELMRGGLISAYADSEESAPWEYNEGVGKIADQLHSYISKCLQFCVAVSEGVAIFRPRAPDA